MKTLFLSLIISGLLTTSGAMAQTSAPVSGKITYEGMRQIDRSQMRMVINGQEVRPGSPGAPDAPDGLPEVISFTQKLVFAGGMAKEERDRQPNMMMRRTIGNGPGEGDGRPRDTRMAPPMEQTTFLDLTNRQRIDVMTVKKDSASTTYRTERAMPSPEGWQLSDKTKKIAGYVCHKATTTYRPSRGGGRRSDAAGSNTSAAPTQGSGEPYTIWYTTDLPFTYSPVAGLTPEKGVVLQIESDSESFKATNVSMEAISETSLQPPQGAKVVTSEEMEQIRRKVMADFRQKMMTTMPFPGSGRN